MLCPIDQSTLVKTTRDGVEIDSCPLCRGIWLDRGELEKILDRAHGEMPGVRSNAPRGNLDRTSDTRPQATNVVGKLKGAMRDRDTKADTTDQQDGPRSSTRRSFLDDLFDF